MEENKVRKLANLMRELDLTGLEISENGTVVRLERTGTAKKALPEATIQINEKEEGSSNLVDICSPMVGMFYSAPAENLAPFVKVGEKVNKGDVLCIIESMKLMNDIIAEQGGTITEVCVENGHTVDFGCVLFRIRKEQE